MRAEELEKALQNADAKVQTAVKGYEQVDGGDVDDDADEAARLDKIKREIAYEELK